MNIVFDILQCSQNRSSEICNCPVEHRVALIATDNSEFSKVHRTNFARTTSKEDNKRKIQSLSFNVESLLGSFCFGFSEVFVDVCFLIGLASIMDRLWCRLGDYHEACRPNVIDTIASPDQPVHSS